MTKIKVEDEQSLVAQKAAPVSAQAEENAEGQAKVAPAPQEDAPHVTQHLDRDLNDPRNRPEAEALPSLNDEGQS